MEKTYKDCSPTICGRDLLSKENIYMTNEVIKEKCDCVNKSVCFEILRLLKGGHWVEADELLYGIK